MYATFLPRIPLSTTFPVIMGYFLITGVFFHISLNMGNVVKTNAGAPCFGECEVRPKGGLQRAALPRLLQGFRAMDTR